MVIASELRAGMVIRIVGQVHKVVEVESKAGVAKMGGVIKTKLIEVRRGRMHLIHNAVRSPPVPACRRHYPGGFDGACSLVSLHCQRPSL